MVAVATAGGGVGDVDGVEFGGVDITAGASAGLALDVTDDLSVAGALVKAIGPVKPTNSESKLLITSLYRSKKSVSASGGYESAE